MRSNFLAVIHAPLRVHGGCDHARGHRKLHHGLVQKLVAGPRSAGAMVGIDHLESIVHD